jgi:hypothetical protein
MRQLSAVVPSPAGTHPKGQPGRSVVGPGRLQLGVSNCPFVTPPAVWVHRRGIRLWLHTSWQRRTNAWRGITSLAWGPKRLRRGQRLIRQWMHLAMTLQEAKAIARHLGLTLRKVRSGKYRVNFRDGNETTAYYADDLEEALKTAVEMARNRAL